MKKIILALGIIGIFVSGSTATFAGYFNNSSIYNCDSQITRYLMLGEDNDEVYTLQQILYRDGYLYATPNGYFGYATRQAVKSFQRDNGIYANGIVNEETRNALNGWSCEIRYANYSSGVTYVDQYDPYARVISPAVTAPIVYTNNVTTFTSSNEFYTPFTSQVQNTNVIYSPFTGYSYGIVPTAGSLTVSSPLQNSAYIEGDTVNLSWSTNNLNATYFTILLENVSTGQSKQVGLTSYNNFSFVLTKDVLDVVCAGSCNNNNSNSYRIVVATPVTDIAGNTSTMRAMISPISIKRPYFFGTVSITGSKSPVNSGEIFKLYTNIPTGASWNSNIYSNYSFKIRAVCPSSVSVNIAGVPCGQDFSIPVATTYFQQEIPTSITNTTWYKQDAVFVLTVSDFSGQTIGTSQTTVSVNPAPFNW